MKNMTKEQYISEISTILEHCNVESVFYLILKLLRKMEAHNWA